MNLCKKLGVITLAVSLAMIMLPMTAFADEIDDAPIPEVTAEEQGTNMKLPTVTIDDSASSLAGKISVRPVEEDWMYEECGLDSSTMTQEERDAFIWMYCAANGGTDATLDNITVKISDNNLSADEENEYMDKTLHSCTPIGADKVVASQNIEVYADGELLENAYGFRCSINGVDIPENDDACAVWTGMNNGYDISMDADSVEWTVWDVSELSFVLVTGHTLELSVNLIETVVIDDATLSFKAGEDIVYTGTVGSDLYEFGDNWCEYWEDDSYSSDDLSKFDYGKTYSYTVGVILTDDAYYNQGYYFNDDTKLILNGVEYDTAPNACSTDDYGEGRAVEFCNILSVETEVKPAVEEPVVTPDKPTQPSQTTVKEDEKTGTTTTVTPKKEDTTKKTDDKKTTKKASKLSVKTKAVKANAKKKTTIKKSKAFNISGAAGKVTFKKVSGNKKISISKAGKVTVKKGLKKGKTYKVKVKVSDAGNSKYKSASKTVTLKVKIKK